MFAIRWQMKKKIILFWCEDQIKKIMFFKLNIWLRLSPATHTHTWTSHLAPLPLYFVESCMHSRPFGWDQSKCICSLLIWDQRRHSILGIPNMWHHLPHYTKRGGGQCKYHASMTLVVETGPFLSLAHMHMYVYWHPT